MAQKSRHLPHLLLAENLLPRRHPTQAYPVRNDVVVLILRHVGRILNKLWCAGIKRLGEGPVGMAHVTVTTRTVSLVDLDPRGQIGLCRLYRVLALGRAPVYRGIQ